MPEVERAVGVGQGAGDENFAFFLWHRIIATITWRALGRFDPGIIREFTF
jgi:hypothetical protein